MYYCIACAELMLLILSKLTPYHYGKVACVSKAWRRLVEVRALLVRANWGFSFFFLVSVSFIIFDILTS